LHREADDVWRIDFQLGWDADPELEKTPERVIPRVRALLGDDVEFDLEWVSVYTFACMRMEKFRHGRVIFAGDAAHGVSPFGARGANSGVQDADNLGWKLGLVLRGEAPVSLLDTYGVEREYAADENILNSTRATDFITPKSAISRVFRDAVLSLSKHHEFAQRLVNSGRLSTPSTYQNSPLNTPDSDSFAGRMDPGAPVADAPVVTANGERHWFLQQVGDRFTTVLFTDAYRPAVEMSETMVLQVLPAGASAPPPSRGSRTPRRAQATRWAGCSRGSAMPSAARARARASDRRPGPLTGPSGTAATDSSTADADADIPA
jgi:3-(3-hydroxy-phenyl)propionate hydroxylase